MATTAMQNETFMSKSVDKDRDKWVENAKDKSFEKSVETEPKMRSWMIVAAGAVVPLGMACAAAVATYITEFEKVAVTAWIAVAIVGTAAVISAAAASRRRVMSLDRDNEGVRTVSRSNEFSKAKAD